MPYTCQCLSKNTRLILSVTALIKVFHFFSSAVISEGDCIALDKVVLKHLQATAVHK